MKHYNCLIARGPAERLELLPSLAGQLPITGLLEESDQITLYFDEGVLDQEMIDQLATWINDESVTFETGEVEEQNWNLEFEQSLEPVRISDRLVITQSWNPVEAEGDELVITIDPKMSFGTGHHESTRLISRLLDNIDLNGRAVMDAGTGTGLLAIIASLRGADRIMAFDNNEWAVENTAENIELNGVSDHIKLLGGELEEIEGTDYDVILANLHRNLIIRLLPQFVERLRNEKSLLLTSGVLYEDYQSLVDACAEFGLRPIAEERENEWIATTFTRSSESARTATSDGASGD